MAATIVWASGKIVGGSLTMKVACPPLREATRQEIILTDIGWGRALYERGVSRSACRNQDEMAGWDEAAIAAMQLPPLQDMIDYGAELQDLEDARLDVEFWRSGQW